ncbi:MAG: rhomboid family intramembrane serine protease [Thermaceae bacterium]
MFPLYDINRARRTPYVVKGLVVLNAVAFLLEYALGPEAIVQSYGFIPTLFFQDPVGEAHRILTSMFLHGGLFHILGNMWFLWVFGDNVEDRMGHGRFLLFYLLGGVAAALTQALTHPSSNIPMIGASGAVSAVLGAYYVLFPRAYVVTLIWLILPFTIAFPAGFYLGYWAFLQLIQGMMGVPGIAFWAHLGGFLFGVLAVRSFTPRWYRY